MFRLLACALGMAGVLAFAGTARADEPIEEAKPIETKVVEGKVVEGKVFKPKDHIMVVNGKIVESAKPVTVRASKVVVKDGKDGKRIEITSEDGKLIAVMRISDGDMKVLSPKSGVFVATADGELVELEDEVEKIEDVVEELEEEVVEAIEEGVRKLAPKTKVIVREVERLVDMLPVTEIVHAFADGKAIGDIEITIKRPDGTTRTLSGKDVGKKMGNFLREYRYEPSTLHKLLDKKMMGKRMPGNGGHLAARITRLEQQNKRMQHELELMRRRMNEMMNARKVHITDAPVRAKRKAAPRMPKIFRDAPPKAHKMPDFFHATPKSKKSEHDSRLRRIEQMLEKLIKMQMIKHETKQADYKTTLKKYFTAAKDKAADVRKKAKDIRAKAPKIHEMIEHSRKRIQELQRILDEEKAKLKDPK